MKTLFGKIAQRFQTPKLTLAVQLPAAIYSMSLGIAFVVTFSVTFVPYLVVSASIFVLTGLLQRYGDRSFEFEGMNQSTGEG